MSRFIHGASSGSSSDSDTFIPDDEEQKLRQNSDWTRVRSRDQFAEGPVTCFNLWEDLKVLLSVKVPAIAPEQRERLVLFDPEVYKGREQELMAEAPIPSMEQLLEYGKMVTEVRASINSRAQTLEAAEPQKAATDAGATDADAIRLQRTYTPMREKKTPVFQHQGLESGMRPDLQKKMRLNQLSSEQLLGIKTAFYTDKSTPKEIAAQFRVNRLLVYRVIKSFRSKSGHLEAL